MKTPRHEAGRWSARNKMTAREKALACAVDADLTVHMQDPNWRPFAATELVWRLARHGRVNVPVTPFWANIFA